MPYSQYKDSGRTMGRVLHQLYTIGIPITIVDSVTIGAGTIHYGDVPFATYTWNEKDIPVFVFVLETYNRVQTEYFNKSEQPC